MWTYDALTVTREQVGPGNYEILPAGTRYIVAVSIQQSAQASDTIIKCGNTVITRNYGKDNPFIQMSYRCTDAITLSKTGNDSAFAIITYIPRDLSKLSPDINAVVTATVTAELTEATRVGLHDFFYLSWWFYLIVIFFLGFNVAKRYLWIHK